MTDPRQALSTEQEVKKLIEELNQATLRSLTNFDKHNAEVAGLNAKIDELKIKHTSEVKVLNDRLSESEIQQQAFLKAQRSLEQDNKNLEARLKKAQDIITAQQSLKDQLIEAKDEVRTLQQEVNRKTKAIKTMGNAQDELREAKRQLKELNALEPKKTKKALGEKKAEVVKQRKDIGVLKSKNKELTEDNTKLSNMVAEQTIQLKASKTALDSMLSEKDAFYKSDDGRWHLRLSGFIFEDEEDDINSVLRVRCLDYSTGTSVLLSDYDEDGKTPIWSNDIGVPEDITDRAIQELQSLKKHGHLIRDEKNLLRV